MSFSSLLPPPIHTSKKKDNKLINTAEEQLKLKALTQGDLQNDGFDTQDKPISVQDLIANSVSFEDFIPLRQRNFNMEISLPTEEEITETYNRTASHFRKLLESSITKSATTGKPKIETKTINSNRVHITTATQDPLQPARFKKSGKIYTPQSEDEPNKVTILHDNNVTPLTPEERAKWKIPGFVSQWKNISGDVISRVDEHGPNKKTNEISEGYNKLSDALEKADYEAKNRIKLKNEQKRIKFEEEVNEKEEKLKLLASRRRYGGANKSHRKREEPLRIEKPKFESTRKSGFTGAGVLVEKLRDLAHQEGRDISEKVILGAAKATKVPELNYDSRLFVKGASAGARRNTEQLYDNPLFAQQDIDSIYKTNYNKLDDAIESETKDRSVMDQVSKATGRDTNESRGPIEFTKATTSDTSNKDTKTHGLQKD